MRARLTLEKFISVSIEKHGPAYDYSLAEYTGLEKKIKIICKSHGLFEQYAGNHMKGNGCPHCKSQKRQKTFHQFLKEANQKYQDKFDYTLLDPSTFVYASSPIRLICREHGEIRTFPRTHIHSRQGGCLQCAKTAHADSISTFDLTEWIESAQIKHGKKYDYTLVDNKSRMRYRVRIICPEHGEFTATPLYHLSSNIGRCKQCYTQSQLMPCDKWIADCSKVHGDYYDYSRVLYTGYLNKVEIGCKKHGTFWQTANEHRSGAQCPRCAKGGSSYAEQKWLTHLGIPNTTEHRQVWLTLFDGQKIKVDGYRKCENMVYEYLGDYYHGNPQLFKPEEKTYFGKTFGDLYESTITRLDKIKQSGYNLTFVWASELNNHQ